MKRTIITTAAAAALLALTAPLARAEVGGEVPAPGLCEYPGVGASHMIGAGPFTTVYVYVCDFPTEINGSHWHAELGGDAVQAALSAGITLGPFNAGGGLTGNLGYIGGSTSWRCPDNSISEPPNPPGAWKNHITPSKCKTIAPNPDLPPPDPDIPPAPDNHATAAVTNPDNPNPDATQNPR